MIPNTHKVPAKQWRRWSAQAKAVFNELYALTLANQGIVTHPKAAKMPPEHWATIAWNTAWLAADAVDENLPARGDTVQDIEKTGRVTGEQVWA